MRGRESGNWNERGLIRRDFRQSGDGPEEITGRPKRRGGDWCKGKEGREHSWQYKVVREWTRKVWGTDTYVTEQEKRWVCSKCSKVSWGDPNWKSRSKHQHVYSETIIEDGSLWTTMYEACAICGRRGKSITIFDK